MSYRDDQNPLLYSADDHRGPLAAAVRGASLKAQQVGNRPMVVLRKLGPFPVPQAENAEMCDVLIDLAEFGLVHDQYNQVVDLVVTKAGPDGTRVTTSRGDSPVPGAPPADPPLSGLVGCYAGLMDGGAGAVADGTDTLVPVGFWGVTEYTYGAVGPGNRCRVMRLHVKRSDVAYTPEEWAVFNSYQLHVNVIGPNNVVDAWRDIPIPATQNEIILNEVIDLNTYGMTSRRGDLRFMLIFKRGGQVIRTYMAGGQEPPWIAHTGEAQYVPPTYPVKWEMRGIIDTEGNDYEYETNNGRGSYAFRYGAAADSLTDNADGDVFVVNKVGDCNESIRSKLSLKVWRPADDGAVDYVQVRGEAAIPIPEGAKDGCTLDVVMLTANPFQQGLYPFEPDNGGRPDPWVERARVDMAQTTYAYSSATLPGADATLAGRIVYLRDPSTAGALYLCRETATDGVYEWLLLT